MLQAQQFTTHGWVNLHLNEYTTIDFQTPYEEVEKGNAMIYSAQDSLGTYKITVRPIPKNLPQSLDPEDLKAIYSNISTEFVTSVHGSLLSTRNYNLGGIIGSEIKYTVPAPADHFGLRYMRLLFAGDDFVTYEYHGSEYKEDETWIRKERFFESLSLDITLMPVHEVEEPSFLSSFFTTMNSNFGYVLMSALGMAFFFFLGSRQRRRRRNWV
jgi:hypothetical protein